MNKIVFENVSKSYNQVKVLDNVSVSIEDGEFVCILGPSGCGKTTMLRMINVMEVATSGNIYIEGKNIKEYDPVCLRRKIGYSIQNSVLFPNMSVRDNISYVPNLLKSKERKKLKFDVEKILEIVNLDKSLIDRYPEELSGGQSQRVALGRAIAANPKILLMDEPFSALDEITRKKLQQEIKSIQKRLNITIIFVTHDVKEALILSDRMMIINKGKIEQFDSPQNIKLNPKTEFIKELISVNN